MTARLPSAILATALLRRVNDAGGFAVVLARGHAEAGAILVVVSEAGGPERLFERGLGPAGIPTLIDSTPTEDVDGYWRRRRQRDPDLWVLALDVAQAERFAAETLLVD